ncbi:phenazine biosynthesis FMN-dependent oxidase PhzG [Streptomyces mexicanus]|uniref:Pyridoxamine 5'-phosphate oxidase n=1 Tax=Streptomyces mexicanus TaxID=178566 RepID=A0A7X1I7L3_9ACTN|nr:phenazine biosynthesis FMN-dependent oxidase PhzG [Streptomyces mexicanus]MBC2869780.1 phenazine biosynthesis FMN-dependent oxidase PhzG [Streptomyces mexicanus]
MSSPAQTLSGDTALDLPEFDTPPPSPEGLLRQWLEEAVRRGVREPHAMVLATADASGRPSSRVLLLKAVQARGLLFTSFRGSRKGRDLAAVPYASATFYWRETLQQITVAGPVDVLGPEESDALFEERPRAARATTAASRQSEPLPDEQELRVRARELASSDAPIPRPEGWTGYLLRPESVEFWYGSPDRLHRRLRYEADGNGWRHQRLQP